MLKILERRRNCQWVEKRNFSRRLNVDITKSGSSVNLDSFKREYYAAQHMSTTDCWATSRLSDEAITHLLSTVIIYEMTVNKHYTWRSYEINTTKWWLKSGFGFDIIYWHFDSNRIRHKGNYRKGTINNEILAYRFKRADEMKMWKFWPNCKYVPLSQF